MENRVFNRIQRLVVKIGSSSLTYPTGKLNIEQIEQLVRQLADLHNRGTDVLLVTSGAVGAGVGKLGLPRRPRTIPEKQAAASVGQGMLLHMYEKIFAEYGVVVGQVLLTREDFADRRRFLNARNTLQTMLGYNIIPVINENDTVAVDEIKLGDNDTLSAMVGGLVDADLLVLLSDIDGLYDGNPGTPGAKIISEVREINDQIERLAGGAGTAVGTGGMITKIHAARVAMHSGLVTIIARASEKDIIRRLVAGEPVGTIFWPSVKLVNKKRWIAFGATVCGRIYIDGGAARAIQSNGRSLLPSGITGVDGDFDVGNTVSIFSTDGKEIARGIVNYAAAEVERIKGKKTTDIEHILGYKDFDEVIHRDNMALE
ncbi:glutamate 5-kinase [Desulfotomaculum arcticum]|uniref:Glutamate 5-kinase n=1 Tax=Desulfotruncus arcticus DSM 17038 TaxID=1121424 RepID=A0A1I2UJV9_9FIRM|nr:glutamate 5-kinase [Desulfotruncus arcticus]SFG77454.1 glutamate 5-kinase [Desulfotomaculum arcticum] [Desulfotruncus arcticus DSM 17038]